MKLHVVEILNPFDPSNLVKTSREFDAGQSLADLFPSNALLAPRQFGINGALIEDDHLASTFPQDGDYVTICAVPAGGDSGKAILRIVAMIALVSFAPMIAAKLSYAMGGGTILGSTMGLAMLEVGVVIAGSALVNAVLPPPKPSFDAGSASSPTYGVDGPKNTSAEGIVVPVGYGSHRTAGNVIQNFTVNLDGGTQLLYMLINAGEGPIAGITGIEINDEPIANYDKDVEYKVAFGDSDQEVMEWFANGNISPVSVNQKILETWKIHTTQSQVERLRIDVSAPGGLFSVDKKGRLLHQFVPLSFECRLAGTANAWQPIKISSETDSSATPQAQAKYSTTRLVEPDGTLGAEVSAGPVIGETVEPDGTIVAPGRGPIGQMIYTIAAATIGDGKGGLGAASRSPVRKSFLSEPLEKGVYEIRYRRNTVKSTDLQVSDEVYLSDVNEITTDPVAYRHTALLALKIKVNDRISGVPNVTYQNGGRLIRVYDEANNRWNDRLVASDNPAWITYDILTNARYGAGSSPTRIPLDRWRDWASWCEANNLTFRGNFDTQTNVWDACNEVARCGRAQIMRVGTRFDVAIERPEAPTMMFSVANMIEGTFKETWLGTSDRANEIEVSYADVADKGRQRTMRIYDKIAFASGAPARSANITIKGIDNPQRAFQEAQIHLNMNRLLLRTVSFGTTPEAMSCRVGDVILVQHDMPQWGYAGRFGAGNTLTTVKLDRDVTLKPSVSYVLRTHYAALRRATGSLGPIDTLSRTVRLNSFNGAIYRQARLKVGTIERAVEDIVPVTGGYGVVLEDVSGLTQGAAYELHEINAMLSTPVVNSASGSDIVTSTLQLAQPLPQVPEQFAQWLFGESNKAGKPFRVKKISGSTEYRRDITAIEYNEDIYDLTGTAPTLNYSDLGSQVINPPELLGITEEVVLINGAWLPRVTVAYRSTQEIYETSEVQVMRDGGAWEAIGRHPERMTITSFQGEELFFRMVPYDRWGNRCSTARCPVHTYTTVGLPVQPAAPETLTVTVATSGITATWVQPEEPDWVNTKVLLGPDFNTAETIFSGKALKCDIEWQPAGLRRIWVVHERSGGVASQPATKTFTINAPAAPVLNVLEESPAVGLVKWSDPTTHQPIRRFLMRVGSTAQAWDDLQDFAVLAGDMRQDRITFATDGTRKVMVRAEDLGGNLGPVASQNLAISGASITGQTGAPGTSTATVSLFQWATTQPANPAGSSTYTWSTASQTGYNGGNGWSLILPPNPGFPGVRLWEARRTISAPAGTLTTTIDWTAGITVAAVGANGSDGAAGASARFASVALFQWALSVPTISGSSVYTWSTSSLSTPLPSGWALNPGNSPSPGMTLWRAQINLADALTTATSAVNWVTASIDAVGYAGANGTPGNFIDYVFRRSPTQPATPTGSGTPAGWFDAPPTGTDPVWMTSAEKTSSNVLIGVWSTPVRLTGEQGAQGAAGAPGPAGASVDVEYSADTVNWHPTFQATDLFMRQRVGTGPWSAAIRIVGEKGSNGANGANGAQGASARVAYAKSTLGSLGTGNVQTAGNLTFPPDNSWGATGWGSSMPALSAGDFGYVTDGIYDPATNLTTWTSPYQAALKVGQLSAISSNLGSINAGQMNIGSGKFVVDPNGYLVARGVRIEDESGNVILQTRNGGASPVPANWITASPSWQNSNITIDGAGAVQGIGSGAGTRVSNSAISLTLRPDGTLSSQGGPSVVGAITPRNLVDASWWAPGAALRWPDANLAGFSSTTFVNGQLPDGTNGIVMRALDNGTNLPHGGPAGGVSQAETLYNEPNSFAIDRTRAYQWVVFFRRISGNGTFWLGCERWAPTEQIAALNSTGSAGNGGYLLGSWHPPVNNRWYVAVGYVYPAGSTGNPSDAGGVWDCETGQKVGGATAYNWAPTATWSQIKFFQYYNTSGVGEYHFWAPSVLPVDGSQYDISDLVSGGYSNRIAVAGTTANWANVSGSGKPQDNATVGAPAGTLVAGDLAQNVVRPGNPINSSNVSTYIANAAIGSAQVGVLTAGNLSVQALDGTINGGRSSGGRVQIDTGNNNGGRIMIFDTANNLRVRLGWLG